MRILEQHPQLLNANWDTYLAQLAKSQHDSQPARRIEELRTLLQRCREAGVKQAFAEYTSALPPEEAEEVETIEAIQALFRARTLDAKQAVVEQNPVLLTGKANNYLLTSDPRLKELVESHRVLLELCREKGIQYAFDLKRKFEHFDQRTQLDAGRLVLEAFGLEEKKEVLLRNKNLLSDTTVLFLDEFVRDARERGADWAESKEVLDAVDETKRLIKRCMTIGIEAAFEEYYRENKKHREALPKEVQDVVDEISALERQVAHRPEAMPMLIEAGRKVLAHLPKDQYPKHFAYIQYMLGKAHTDNRCPELVNTRQAITHLRNAEEVAQSVDVGWLHPTILLSLGNLFASAVEGDMESNQVQALNYYWRAAEKWSQNDDPVQLATVKGNAANVLNELIQGDLAANKEAAIAHYKEALGICPAAMDANVHVTLRINLAAAYINRIHGDRIDNLRQAVAELETARQWMTEALRPLKEGNVSLNLGSAFLALAAAYGNLPDPKAVGHSLDSAFAALEQAQRQYRAADRLTQYGLATAALAEAYVLGAEAGRTVEDETIITCFERALQYVDAREEPKAYQNVLENAARFYFLKERWPESRTAHDLAIQHLEVTYGANYFRRSRGFVLKNSGHLYQQAAFTAYRLGDVPAAFTVLERGRTRLFKEDLKRRARRPAGVPDDAWENFSQVSFGLRGSDWEAKYLPGYDIRDEWAQKTHADFEKAIAEVQKHNPDFLKPFSFADLQPLLSGNRELAIVDCCVTEKGSVAFVFLPGRAAEQTLCIPIPDFTRQQLNNLLLKHKKDGVTVPGWLDAYFDTLPEPAAGTTSPWRQLMEGTLSEIGRHLLTPLARGLPGTITQLIFLSSNELSVLPLHAAPLVDREETARQTLLCDRFEVSYLPCFEILARLKDLPAVAPDAFKLYAAINPEEDRTLHFAHFEGRLIGKCFRQSRVDAGQAATKESVVGAMKDATHLHFACHASFNWQDPYQSGIRLADGAFILEELLMGEIMLETIGNGHAFLTRFIETDNVQLLTLSACESGITDVINDKGGERIGLPTGFMLAGVRYVVSSLWEVNDLSTSLLMEKFYQLLHTGLAPAAALRQAQQWLKNVPAGQLADRFKAEKDKPPLERMLSYEQASQIWRKFAACGETEKPFSHPYYWAAFSLVGI